MAWQLVVEVFDHAPADLTAAEMTVLLALADWSPVESRETSRPMPELARRARLSKTGLRAALRRLSARGLEVRVPIREDSNGEPLYAVTGRSPQFRLPEFPRGVTTVTPHGVTTVTPPDEDGVTAATPTDGDGVTVVTGRGHHSDQTGSPQRPLNGTTYEKSSKYLCASPDSNTHVRAREENPPIAEEPNSDSRLPFTVYSIFVDEETGEREFLEWNYGDLASAREDVAEHPQSRAIVDNLTGKWLDGEPEWWDHMMAATGINNHVVTEGTDTP